MSGQPNRKPEDVDDFRKDYMDQLNLRAAIDNVNYQANKTYKATGALPPQSSMPDTRSTTEILADVARLKTELISEFKPLLNAPSASLLIQRVEQSPYNADGSLLVFLSQNAKQIVPKLQMRYTYGIKGDEGDIETLKTFIENLYFELKDSTGSIKSFFDRPQSSTSINLGDFIELIRQYDKIRLQLLSKYPNNGGLPTKLSNAFDRILEIFDRLDMLINSPQALDRSMITSYINGILTVNPAGPLLVKRAQLLEQFIDSLPNPASLRSLISQLNKSIKNSNSDLSYNILQNMEGILPNVLNDMTLAELKDLIDDIISQTYTLQLSSSAHQQATSANQQLGSQLPSPPSAPPSSGPPPSVSSSQSSTNMNLTDLSTALSIVYLQILKSISAPATALKAMLQATNHVIRDFLSSNSTSDLGSIAPSGNYDPQQGADLVNDIFALNTPAGLKTYTDTNAGLNNGSIDEAQIKSIIFSIVKTSLQNLGVQGSGFKKRSGRRRGSGLAVPKKFLVDKVDHDKGIKPDKKYVPFGKYYIHSHKLNDNILSFRQPSGVCVVGQPSHRVSDKLGNVLRCIIGGKVPSFNDLNGLSDEEKNYLYKVAKKADISDKLSIPTPSKDAQEKDIHDFEVMKGEIMAGNDSKELIKKFKLLLLRLSKNGSLPKTDVQEIMEELLTLGY